MQRGSAEVAGKLEGVNEGLKLKAVGARVTLASEFELALVDKRVRIRPSVHPQRNFFG